MDKSISPHSFASVEKALEAYTEVLSKLHELKSNSERQNILGPEDNKKIVDQILRHVAFLKTPTMLSMISYEEEDVIAEAERLVKSIQFLTAYQESHPDETDIALVGLNYMTPGAFSRFGFQKRTLKTPHNIVERIRENFSQRGIMDKNDTFYEEYIKGQIDALSGYKVMHTKNGGNTTFPAMVNIYLQLAFSKKRLGTSPVMLDSVVLNLGSSPLLCSVKNSHTDQKTTTLLGGTIEIDKVFFNHDSPSSGANNRRAILDSGDNLQKKVDDLQKATTDIEKALISSEVYRDLFKDEYLCFVTEFKKEMSVEAAIARCYALMKLAGTERSMWVLTSGMEWAFGIVSIEESDQTTCHFTEIKKVEEGEDIREVMMTALYWACTPSSQILNLYEIAPEA